MLVDEPEEDETEADAERDPGRLSPESEQLLKSLTENLEAEKAAGEKEGDDEEKSSSNSEVDETERWKKLISDKDKQKKRKRSGDDDDDFFKDFPNIPENIPLEEIGDFSFVNDELVKKLQKKVEDVLVEKNKLEKRVKTVEAENSSLLKKVEVDQADIDILKVRVAELEKEKARRDEQNEYFKLKKQRVGSQQR
ncbi:serrate RNA effector molecule homolog [Helianthus annuus]|uniref:serrate RNA effector molecule homolog n=1 Tax=Helianthus annuus TaxID=4232 RepID=UPI001653051B|nr:serrate RNA effector molecule homolog [Helianthus annuus]